ncbi:MAG: metallophosphoesterase [Tatlockia sp.]|nr:metallophosphoesterase [Tatlockia sp.]
MKIIQISDLHFGMHNPALIEPFLNDLRVIKPDLILISGDLTQRAKEDQFNMAKNFLAQLPAPFLIVPGNHDIPLYNPFSRIFNPFYAYKREISSELLETSFTNDEINVLGVNSVNPYKIKDGKLSKETLDRIRNHFSDSSGHLNILFFHHNLNYFSGMHHPLNNAEEFIDYLKISPIHMVCTGHLHYANVKIISKNESQKFALLHAGSLFCERSRDKMNSYYLIETNQLSCDIEMRVFSKDIFVSHQRHAINFSPTVS